jgi:hypothetical protein
MRGSLLILALLVCSRPLTGAERPFLSTEPVKWTDADSRNIAEPRDVEENQIWDIADHTFFYQIGKVLDLGWSARKLGNLVGVAPRRQADNVNALEEVPASSWFTNRHFLHPMTRAELERGAGFAVPADHGSWEIVAGKFEGGTAGFTIKDAAGAYFLLKFDAAGNNEMGSAAEVIATKILHAAGYNVPRNSIVLFAPERLVIGSRARVPVDGGGKRPMTPADLEGILDNINPQPDGRLRCVASQFLTGKPVGVFNYHGRRPDDPNDRVDHQHRRELRGLRVIASLMNDADRRAANTLDMYVTEPDGRSYVRHNIIDMGSAFGSNNLEPHRPKYGNEYVWDPRTVFRSLVSLGLYRKPWNYPLPMPYPELGYFENETFDPGSWVPTYPNPAFEACTSLDAYWGAKIVMALDDLDIAAMVGRGRYSNPDAAAELTRLLCQRRDIIGRYWFARVNPLDRFVVTGTALGFTDLAVDGGLEDAAATEYRIQPLDSSGRALGAPRILPASGAAAVGVDVVATQASDELARRISVSGRPRVASKLYIPVAAELTAGDYHGFGIRTRRDGGAWSKSVRVYMYKWDDERLQVVRVARQQ